MFHRVKKFLNMDMFFLLSIYLVVTTGYHCYVLMNFVLSDESDKIFTLQKMVNVIQMIINRHALKIDKQNNNLTIKPKNILIFRGYK